MQGRHDRSATSIDVAAEQPSDDRAAHVEAVLPLISSPRRFLSTRWPARSGWAPQLDAPG